MRVKTRASLRIEFFAAGEAQTLLELWMARRKPRLFKAPSSALPAKPAYGFQTNVATEPAGRVVDTVFSWKAMRTIWLSVPEFRV